MADDTWAGVGVGILKIINSKLAEASSGCGNPKSDICEHFAFMNSTFMQHPNDLRRLLQIHVKLRPNNEFSRACSHNYTMHKPRGNLLLGRDDRIGIRYAVYRYLLPLLMRA